MIVNGHVFEVRDPGERWAILIGWQFERDGVWFEANQSLYVEPKDTAASLLRNPLVEQIRDPFMVNTVG